jgi:hypothetical protein
VLRRPYAAFLIALRVFAVLVGLQFSGFIHGAADVAEAVLAEAVLAEHAVEHEQCPADGPCDDCPPGCPNCHCSAAVASVVPAAAASLATVLGAEMLPPCLYATQAPAGPELPTLFRPPRA